MSRLLFREALIPQSVKAAVPRGYTVRPLAEDDDAHGHLACLRALTAAPEMEEGQWRARFDYMSRGGGGSGGGDVENETYYIVVIQEDATSRVVATGTIFIERKFLREGGLVGHIEDIAVLPEMQGKQFGLRLIEALVAIGETCGCYKTILDCAEKNIPFYRKCGFEQKEVEMTYYYNNAAARKRQEYKM